MFARKVLFAILTFLILPKIGQAEEPTYIAVTFATEDRSFVLLPEHPQIDPTHTSLRLLPGESVQLLRQSGEGYRLDATVMDPKVASQLLIYTSNGSGLLQPQTLNWTVQGDHLSMELPSWHSAMDDALFHVRLSSKAPGAVGLKVARKLAQGLGPTFATPMRTIFSTRAPDKVLWNGKDQDKQAYFGGDAGKSYDFAKPHVPFLRVRFRGMHAQFDGMMSCGLKMQVSGQTPVLLRGAAPQDPYAKTVGLFQNESVAVEQVRLIPLPEKAESFRLSTVNRCLFQVEAPVWDEMLQSSHNPVVQMDSKAHQKWMLEMATVSSQLERDPKVERQLLRGLSDIKALASHKQTTQELAQVYGSLKDSLAFYKEILPEQRNTDIQTQPVWLVFAPSPKAAGLSNELTAERLPAPGLNDFRKNQDATRFQMPAEQSTSIAFSVDSQPFANEGRLLVAMPERVVEDQYVTVLLQSPSGTQSLRFLLDRKAALSLNDFYQNQAMQALRSSYRGEQLPFAMVPFTIPGNTQRIKVQWQRPELALPVALQQLASKSPKLTENDILDLTQIAAEETKDQRDKRLHAAWRELTLVPGKAGAGMPVNVTADMPVNATADMPVNATADMPVNVTAALQRLRGEMLGRMTVFEEEFSRVTLQDLNHDLRTRLQESKWVDRKLRDLLIQGEYMVFDRSARAIIMSSLPPSVRKVAFSRLTRYYRDTEQNDRLLTMSFLASEQKLVLEGMTSLAEALTRANEPELGIALISMLPELTPELSRVRNQAARDLGWLELAEEWGVATEKLAATPWMEQIWQPFSSGFIVYGQKQLLQSNNQDDYAEGVAVAPKNPVKISMDTAQSNYLYRIDLHHMIAQQPRAPFDDWVEVNADKKLIGRFPISSQLISPSLSIVRGKAPGLSKRHSLYVQVPRQAGAISVRTLKYPAVMRVLRSIAEVPETKDVRISWEALAQVDDGKIRNLLWEAETQNSERGRSARIEGEHLILKTPENALHLQDIRHRFLARSLWQPLETGINSVGMEQSKVNGWQPDSPGLQAQSQLTESDATDDWQVLSNQQILQTTMQVQQGSALQIIVKRNNPLGIVPQDATIQTYVDGGTTKSLRIGANKHTGTLNVNLAPGSHYVELHFEARPLPEFFAIRLAVKAPADKDWQIVRLNQSKRWHVATAGRKVGLTVTQPTLIRIHKLQNGSEQVSYRMVNAAQKVAFGGDKDGKQLYRFFQLSDTAKDLPSVLPELMKVEVRKPIEHVRLASLSFTPVGHEFVRTTPATDPTRAVSSSFEAACQVDESEHGRCSYDRWTSLSYSQTAKSPTQNVWTEWQADARSDFDRTAVAHVAFSRDQDLSSWPLSWNSRLTGAKQNDPRRDDGAGQKPRDLSKVGIQTGFEYRTPSGARTRRVAHLAAYKDFYSASESDGRWFEPRNDPLYFSDWRRRHGEGATAAYGESYQPWFDSWLSWNALAWSNPFTPDTVIDHTNLRATASMMLQPQLIGSFGVHATTYFADEHRKSQYWRFGPEMQVLAYLWEGRDEALQLGGQVGFDAYVHAPEAAVSLRWTFDQARSLQNYRDGSGLFQDLRQQLR